MKTLPIFIQQWVHFPQIILKIYDCSFIGHHFKSLFCTSAGSWLARNASDYYDIFIENADLDGNKIADQDGDNMHH